MTQFLPLCLFLKNTQWFFFFASDSYIHQWNRLLVIWITSEQSKWLFIKIFLTAFMYYPICIIILKFELRAGYNCLDFSLKLFHIVTLGICVKDYNLINGLKILCTRYFLLGCNSFPLSLMYLPFLQLFSPHFQISPKQTIK